MRQLSRGDTFFTTRETELAAVLAALDFEFFDPESPAEVRYEKGKVVTIWLFESSNKNDIKALDVYKHWKNTEKAVTENPEDPITYAICAVKNLRVFNDSIKKAEPVHGFKLGSHTLWVRESDPKFKKLKSDPRAIKL
jgi:hypothetical protein